MSGTDPEHLAEPIGREVKAGLLHLGQLFELRLNSSNCLREIRHTYLRLSTANRRQLQPLVFPGCKKCRVESVHVDDVVRSRPDRAFGLDANAAAAFVSFFVPFFVSWLVLAFETSSVGGLVPRKSTFVRARPFMRRRDRHARALNRSVPEEDHQLAVNFGLSMRDPNRKPAEGARASPGKIDLCHSNSQRIAIFAQIRRRRAQLRKPVPIGMEAGNCRIIDLQHHLKVSVVEITEIELGKCISTGFGRLGANPDLDDIPCTLDDVLDTLAEFIKRRPVIITEPVQPMQVTLIGRGSLYPPGCSRAVQLRFRLFELVHELRRTETLPQKSVLRCDVAHPCGRVPQAGVFIFDNASFDGVPQPRSPEEGRISDNHGQRKLAGYNPKVSLIFNRVPYRDVHGFVVG